MRLTNIALSVLLGAALVPGVAFADTVTADSTQAKANIEATTTGSVDDATNGQTTKGSTDESQGLTANAESQAASAASETTTGKTFSTSDKKLTTQDETDTAINDFVTRLYNLVLDREPDMQGLVDQVAGVKSMGAGQIALNFFNSEEFLSKTLTNEERVEIVYKTILDRASDDSGRAMWVSYLDNGMSILSVVVGFAEAPEFTTLCASWGVDPGNVSSLRQQLEVRDQNPSITAYVHRMYSLVLGRSNPTAAEVNYQCKALIDGLSASQLAMNFFLSDEFQGKSLSAEEQVTTAYQAILDREPDSSGLAYWVEGFNYQMTTEGVVAGFANSEEFKTKCATWGVNPGSVSVKYARNKSQAITRAIYKTYELAFNRVPDASGLDNWCNVCAEKGLIWVCAGFIESAEMTALATTNEKLVEQTYLVCLGREAESAGLAHWTEYLDKGYNAYALLAGFCQSSEFVNRCADLKVPAGTLAYYAVSTNHTLNLKISEIIQNITGLDAYKCFLYVSSFTYHSRGLWPSYDGWMEEYALNFINDGGGNCYGYAALFAYLARACGYSTDVHQGSTTSSSGGTTPHGWCEVYVDGQTLVVDPDLYHELGVQCYMVPYSSAPFTYYL